MKDSKAIHGGSGVVAVLHRAGRTWRAVAASIRDGRAAIGASRAFSIGEIGRLDQWLDEQQAGSVLCVLPAATVICRNVVLPDASPAQLELALRLQAEGLGVAAGPHRAAMAVLPAAAGETSRSGIILSWPESATFDPPPTSRPVTFVPDVAALAAILNGQRPAEPLLWLDRSDGSVAMALTHAGGATFRATRGDCESVEEWSQSVGRIVAETALGVSHTGVFIESLVGAAQEAAGALKAGEAALVVPPELRAAASTRAQGLADDAAWWRDYGIAAGAVLARGGQLASLTQIRQAALVETPSRLLQALERMSRPGMAVRVAVACALVLLLGPLALSGLRLQILRWRFGDVQQQLSAVTAARQQFSMYNDLQSQNAWPMTKLLADITANTPLGVKLEMIRLEAGKEFSLSGTVMSHNQRSAPEIFAVMQDNLQRDGMFTELKPNLENGKNFNNSFDFDLSGKVSKPYADVEYPEERDFGKLTYAVRLYGDRASGKADATGEGGTLEPTGEDVAADDSADDPGDPMLAVAPEQGDAQAGGEGRAGRRPPRGDTAGAGAANPYDSQGDAAVAPSKDVPPELTEEQIKAMELPQLQEALQKVANARQYHRGEDELSVRLKKEMDMLMAQIRKVRGK